jgi:hypothetical protein
MAVTHADLPSAGKEATGEEPTRHLRFLEEYQHLTSPFGSSGFGSKAEEFARFFGTPKFLIVWVPETRPAFAKSMMLRPLPGFLAFTDATMTAG